MSNCVTIDPDCGICARTATGITSRLTCEFAQAAALRRLLRNEAVEGNGALAGRAGLRDGGTCHPADLPEGYHPVARGRS